MAAFIKIILFPAVISALFRLWRWKSSAAQQKELEFIFFADENRQMDKEKK